MKGITIYKCLTLIIFLLIAQITFAQQALVKASVDKNKILLGEPLVLTLETRTPGNIKAVPFKIDSIPHFEFLQSDSSEKENIGGAHVLKQFYTITSFDSGQWVIPAFVLMPGVKTLPVIIDVMFSEPFDPTQPYHDVQDVRDVPSSTNFELWWYIIAALLILLTLIIYWLTAEKKPKPAKPVPKGDPYKQALYRLEELKKEQPEEKVFYTRLVDIFRTYVLERTGIESLQQTSNDLVDKLKPLFKNELQYDSIAQVLYLCDFVKFAKYDPADSEAVSAFEVVSQSIDHIEKQIKLSKPPKNASPAVGGQEGTA